MKFDEEKYETFEDVPLCLIYFLIQDEEVVYVGQTTQGFSRIQAHKNKQFNKVNYIRCRVDELDELESKYIVKYNPLYNKVLPPNYFIKFSTAVSYINKAVFDRFKKYNKFSKHKLSKICNTLNYDIINYNGELYIDPYIYYDIQEGIIIYALGGPVDEVYNIGI